MGIGTSSSSRGRTSALHARAEAFPLGLGVLAHGGVTAWRHALADLAPAGQQGAAAPACQPSGPPPARTAGLPVPVTAELISALAAVTLAAAGGAPP